MVNSYFCCCLLFKIVFRNSVFKPGGRKTVKRAVWWEALAGQWRRRPCLCVPQPFQAPCDDSRGSEEVYWPSGVSSRTDQNCTEWHARRQGWCLHLQPALCTHAVCTRVCTEWQDLTVQYLIFATLASCKQFCMLHWDMLHVSRQESSAAGQSCPGRGACWPLSRFPEAQEGVRPIQVAWCSWQVNVPMEEYLDLFVSFWNNSNDYFNYPYFWGTHNSVCGFNMWWLSQVS